MSEATPEAATPGAGLTDDHAQALLADALNIANQENGAHEADPADLEGYRALVGKLRDEIKAVKSDRTPQDEKDAKVIASLRRQLESTPSPEDVKKELAQTIGKALGLVEDDAEVDPAALTEKLTASQQAARQAQVELAVFRAAAGSDADPAALLDSRTFLEKVAEIDPADGDAIKQAIAEVVASNPRLGKAPTPGMKPNPAQGRSASPPLGLADQIAAAQKAGDMRTVMRLKAAQAVTNSTS